MGISAKNFLNSFPEIGYQTAKLLNKLIKEYGNPKDVDKILEIFNQAVRNYGIEAISGRDWINNYYGNINLLYSNTGDTYAKTLIYDTLKDRFYLTSWGDIVEYEMERFDI